MRSKKEWIKLAVMVGGFAACWFVPVVTFGTSRLARALTGALGLTRSYARAHVLLCLVPAFFIAGAIAVFVSQASVMKYLGARANKLLAYGVASVSGAVLAVCSCTVLPLFAGVYRMGAGVGPAATFLYAGPAINVLAIILTARVLGIRLGVARAVGAVVFSVVIGLAMHLIFRNSEHAKAEARADLPPAEPTRPLWKNAAFFAVMVGILVFANWARAGSARAVFLCCDEGEQLWQVSGRILERDEQ
ncbi:MAG: permease, partial [Planctomycetota bacterium]